jgi:hypothetical protein
MIELEFHISPAAGSSRPQAPYFCDGRRGRYATRLKALAKRARAGRRGLWGACPRRHMTPTGVLRRAARQER